MSLSSDKTGIRRSDRCAEAVERFKRLPVRQAREWKTPVFRGGRCLVDLRNRSAKILNQFVEMGIESIRRLLGSGCAMKTRSPSKKKTESGDAHW